METFLRAKQIYLNKIFHKKPKSNHRWHHYIHWILVNKIKNTPNILRGRKHNKRPLRTGRAQSINSITTPVMTPIMASISSRTRLIGWNFTHQSPLLFILNRLLWNCYFKTLCTTVEFLKKKFWARGCIVLGYYLVLFSCDLDSLCCLAIDY